MISVSPKQITYARLYTILEKSAAVKDMEITGRDRTHSLMYPRHSNLEYPCFKKTGKNRQAAATRIIPPPTKSNIPPIAPLL